MPKTKIREQVIIQLGDFHFPDLKASTTAVDNKDSAPPGDLDATLGLPITHALRESLIAEITTHPDAIIAVCGDITSRGDEDGFREGIEFLRTILHDPRIEEHTPEARLHIVPGNHDIDFQGKAPFESWKDTDRFESLAKMVEGAGLGDIFTRSTRTTEVSVKGGGRVKIVSVNTCRGTGATRRDIPGGGSDELLETAVELIPESNGVAPNDRLQQALDAKPISRSVFETLDVPLLHPEDLGNLTAEFASTPDAFAVVLAHHGLLPQHTPRLNPYTEMVNAGQARKALDNLNRSVLYLHGHIHQHTVEILDFPKANDNMPMHDRTVIVSAPELRDGFNKIVIQFNAHEEALGLRVEKYRIVDGEQSVSRSKDIVEISLLSRDSLTAAQRSILALVIENGAATGAEFLEKARKDGKGMNSSDVHALIEDLRWTGVLRRTAPPHVDFARMGYML